MSPSSSNKARFDSLLFQAWCHRLRGFAGSRLQKIFQPEPLTLVLKLYPSPEGLPLLLRAKGGDLLGWVDLELANPQTPSAFCMLLRKYLEGSFLRDAQLPVLDRCLHLVFEGKDQAGEIRSWRLVFELLGTRANLHLLDQEDRVLGSCQRYPTDRERFGRERRYQPPTLPGERILVQRKAPEALDQLLKAAPDPSQLAHQLAGLTRPLAELSAASESPRDFLLGVLDPDFEAEDKLSYQLVSGPGRSLALVGQLPSAWPEGYASESFPDLDSLTRSAFLEATQEDRSERSRRECRKALKGLLERLERQLEKNQQGREECARVGELRVLGELLKTNLGAIQKGATSVAVTDFYTGEPVERVIPLDSRKSAKANMDHYFQRAKRLTLKLPMLERKRRHLETELDHARELERRFLNPDLDPLVFKEELRASGLFSTQKKPKDSKKGKKKGKDSKKRELRTFVSSDGLRILVGRSNEENDYLVRRAGKKGDAWLHAQGTAGAHVLVKLTGKMQRPPARTLEEAAQLAAHFSHSRYEAKAKIMLSSIGVVKKAPNSGPGQVLVPKFETLVVTTDPGILRRLSPLGSGRTSR